MATNTKEYYVLVERYPAPGGGGQYIVQFGSYVYDECLSERDLLIEHGVKLKHLKILTVEGDTQEAIDKRVRELNQEIYGRRN